MLGNSPEYRRLGLAKMSNWLYPPCCRNYVEKMSTCKTTIYSESWGPGWTMPLKEAALLGLPHKGPHRDFKEPLERFFGNV